MINLKFKYFFKNGILKNEIIHTLQVGEKYKIGDSVSFYLDLTENISELFAIGKIEDVINNFMYFDGNNIYFNLLFLEKYKYFDRTNLKFPDNIVKNNGFDNIFQMIEFFKMNCKIGKYQLVLWDCDLLKYVHRNTSNK